MQKQKNKVSALELSRPLVIESIIKDRKRIEKIKASEEELQNLAKRLHLKELLNLEGELEILRASGSKVLRVQGSIKAEVVQTCVISFEDVYSEVDVVLNDDFVKDGKVFDKDLGFDIEIENEFDDVVTDGVIDLGELVAQHLSLEIEPYPKAPGVKMASQLSESGEDIKNNPFLALKRLKEKKSKN